MDLLAIFKKAQITELTGKEAVVARLLNENAISVGEAALLLKTIDIFITADKLSLSSGAKIIGGSDFETHNFNQ